MSSKIKEEYTCKCGEKGQVIMKENDSSSSKLWEEHTSNDFDCVIGEKMPDSTTDSPKTNIHFYCKQCKEQVTTCIDVNVYY